MKLADAEAAGSDCVPAAKWGTVQFAQMILDEQGYLVLGHNSQEAIPGEEFQLYSAFGLGPSELGRLMIVSTANRRDFETQAQRFYPPHKLDGFDPEYMHYHKVIAE